MNEKGNCMNEKGIESGIEIESEIIDKIVIFIRSKVKDAGANGAIIGLSGGIDSTLVAYITVEALGPNNVLGVMMPDHNTSGQDIDDATDIANVLQIVHKKINISQIESSFMKSIPTVSMSDNIKPSGNLKARIRMCILYYYANHMNRMVIGTGNKTELLLGYFTKYGDGGVDIEPIGDLYKTQVRSLSRYLEIPSRIVDKVPTAGLWPGQTDEGELGITYETIDKILIMLVDEKQDISIVKKKFPSEHVDKLLGLIRINEHKRISAQSCGI